MVVNFKPNHISSCIVVAKINNENVSFNVSYNDIEPCKAIIEDICGEESKPYISGFDLVNEGRNLTLEQIMDKANRLLNGLEREEQKTLLYRK